MLRVACVLVLSGCCGIATAAAEDAPYVEYRYVRAIGQIQITLGFMERSETLDSRKASLERDGVVILETGSPRQFSRTEHAGTHVIVTTISIEPPVGHGEGGASSFADIRIALDGHAIVDAPLVRGWGGLDRINVDPQRRFVTIAGHEGIVRYDGFESRRVVDEQWMAERARTVRALIENRK
jgi:hypothetical protein